MADSGIQDDFCQTIALRRYQPSACSANATRQGIPSRSFSLTTPSSIDMRQPPLAARTVQGSSSNQLLMTGICKPDCAVVSDRSRENQASSINLSAKGFDVSCNSRISLLKVGYQRSRAAFRPGLRHACVLSQPLFDIGDVPGFLLDQDGVKSARNMSAFIDTELTAAWPVVPVPANISRTVPPFGHINRHSHSNNAIGLTVG